MFAVYVSNAESGDITVLHLDPARRTLTPVQNVDIGGEVMPLALSPKRDRLYAARRSEPREVLSFAIDPKSGELAPLGAGALPHSMAYIATDRAGRFLAQRLVRRQSDCGQRDRRQRRRPGGTQQVLPTEPNAHAILPDPSNRFVLRATSLGGGVVNAVPLRCGDWSA